MKAKTRSHWGWLLGATLLVGGCIKSEAPVGGPAAVSPVAAAPTEPTGNYGKVQGENVIGAAGLRAFALQGDTNQVEIGTAPVSGQPFSEALRVRVKDAAPNPWDLQLSAKTATAVEAGDVLLATFYFRAEHARDESGEGRVEFVFELARDPWTKSTSYEIRAGSEWKQVHVPFQAAASYAAGEAQLNFRVGFQAQTIELGGVTVENFGKQLALADLPVTKITYRGMEPDAAWRVAAAERIEKHRKGDLTVVVQDAAGKVVPGAKIRLELVRHEFGFGTCVAAQRLVDPGNERYRLAVTELFNVATIENNLKWAPLAGDWGGEFTMDRARRAVDWLRGQGLDVRGHVLVWPGWKNLPKSLRQYEKNPQALRTEVDHHVRELGAAMRGRLVHWDVVNEPYDNHDLLDILGQGAMVEWFKAAREVEPEARLFINDYAILSGGGGTTPHRDHYEKTIRFLIEQGAPVGGIGLQGHFGTSLTSPEELLTILDRFAVFDRMLYVTEYDVVVDDEELAASYTRDFYTTLFSHPAVGGVVMWGFWDEAHWKKNAPVYRKDWSLKPAGQAYMELVKKRWHTDLTGQSDAAGQLVTRGFLGRYRVEVVAGSKRKVAEIALPARGASVTVKLD